MLIFYNQQVKHRDEIKRRTEELNDRNDEVQKAAQRYLTQQLNLQILTRVCACESQDLLQTIQNLVELDAKTLQVDRVSIWRFNDTRTKLVCQDMYQLTFNRHTAGFEIAVSDYPEYFNAINTYDVVAANDAQEDDRMIELCDSYLKPNNIVSMMDAPIFLYGKLEGVVCHENVSNERIWLPDEQTFALAVANLATLTFERYQHQLLLSVLDETTQFMADEPIRGGENDSQMQEKLTK